MFWRIALIAFAAVVAVFACAPEEQGRWVSYGSGNWETSLIGTRAAEDNVTVGILRIKIANSSAPTTYRIYRVRCDTRPREAALFEEALTLDAAKAAARRFETFRPLESLTSMSGQALNAICSNLDLKL